jgi:hypothetical protein
MKAVRFVAIAAILASCFSLSAFAKDKNEAKFTLPDTAQLGSTQLKPGDYKLQWDGTGPTVQVKVLKGKQVVATSSAKLVEKKETTGTDAVTLGPGNGTVKSLDQVDFSNGKQSLVFRGTSTQASNMQH